MRPWPRQPTRIEFGTLVLRTAFRNPALLAKMADAVDEVSAGRLILGLGAGWHEPEFSAFGYPFDHLASRFEDALRIIAPLVRGGGVDYQGAVNGLPTASPCHGDRDRMVHRSWSEPRGPGCCG